MSKREIKKQARKETIIEIAKQLFLDRGLQEVQMKEIADAANIGIATLFRYFPKKELLVITVANSIVAEMDEVITKIINLPLSAYDKMSKIFDYYIQLISNDTIKLIRFHQSFDVFTAITDVDSEELSIFVEPREKLAQTIFRLIEQGKIDGTIRQDIDNELLIMTTIQNFSLFGITVATEKSELRIPTSYDPFKQMHLLKKIFLDFIKS